METKELKYYNLDKIIVVTIRDKELTNYKYLPTKFFKLLWFIPVGKHPFFITYNEGWYKNGERAEWRLLNNEELEFYIELKDPAGIKLYDKPEVRIRFQDEISVTKYFDTFEEAENYVKENLPVIYSDQTKFKILS